MYDTKNCFSRLPCGVCRLTKEMCPFAENERSINTPYSVNSADSGGLKQQTVNGVTFVDEISDRKTARKNFDDGGFNSELVTGD